MSANMGNNIVSCVDPLGFPFKTEDPFLFCVYHKDNFPAGDKNMFAPRRGNGQDFNPNQAYRMYHGDRIPGFPQHPHRGFETVTATMEGLIDHTDSLGNGGRYGQGDLQWMTAGSGVVHGEMFPLINSDRPNPCRFFQIWLNLPSKSKMVPPDFAMHWAERIPKVLASDGKSEITVWAGSYGPETGLPPPPNSYGSDPSSDISILFIRVHPGGSVDLPPAAAPDTNRVAYFVEGTELHVNGVAYTTHCALTLRSNMSALLSSPPSSTLTTEVLILQGRPIGEPVAQHGPFVMNTQEEIKQAFADYRRTQFGGWPWPEDAMVFPRDKGRFSLMNGKEETPQGK